MEVVREIELDADPEDVWSALTDETQLEEWFANEVELDPTPGGRGVFRWDNGETREAVVESVEEGSRIVLRFDDDGVVDLRVVPVEGGTSSRSASRRLPGRPRSSSAADLVHPVDAVFSALADPAAASSSRHSLPGHRDPDRLAADLPVTRQAVAKQLAALREAGLVEAKSCRTGDALRADAAPLMSAPDGSGLGDAWDARLAALKRV